MELNWLLLQIVSLGEINAWLLLLQVGDVLEWNDVAFSEMDVEVVSFSSQVNLISDGGVMVDATLCSSLVEDVAPDSLREIEVS